MNTRRSSPFWPLTLMLFQVFLLGLLLFFVVTGLKIRLGLNGLPEIVFPLESATNNGPGLQGVALKTYGLQLQADGFIDDAAIVLEDYIRGVHPDSDIQPDLIYFSLVLAYIDAEDYASGLKYAYKALAVNPESSKKSDILAKKIFCLEKMGRSQAANLVLNTLDADPPDVVEEEDILARVGDSIISTLDYEIALKNYPDAIQNKILNNKVEKAAFLKNLVLYQMLYHKALRLGMQEDAVLNHKVKILKKNVMAEMLLEMELGSSREPKRSELEDHFRTHQEQFMGSNGNSEADLGDYLEAVKQDYLVKKRQEQLTEIFKKLAGAEQITLYEDRLH